VSVSGEEPRMPTQPGAQSTAWAPMRIDLTGGFTDVEPFCLTDSTVHVNLAMSVGVRASCTATVANGVRVRFDDAAGQIGSSASSGRVRLVRAIEHAARTVEFERSVAGVEIVIRSDMPPGTGMGSSGAILVACIAAMAGMVGLSPNRELMAQRAIDAARACGLVGGKQDEYAAALGSLNAYWFDPKGAVAVERLASPFLLRYVERTMVVALIGSAGRATDHVRAVVDAVRAGDPATTGALRQLNVLAQALRDAMRRSEVDALAPLIERIRLVQAALGQGMEGPETAAAMHALRQAVPDATYKLLGGAGAGGCVLLHVPGGIDCRVGAALTPWSPRMVPVRCQHQGVRLVGAGESVPKDSGQNRK
jgi:D-glycero-alpha-D-manno-heptose-7-phosphate kinase